jgi:hypothetical protein
MRRPTAVIRTEARRLLDPLVRAHDREWLHRSPIPKTLRKNAELRHD